MTNEPTTALAIAPRADIVDLSPEETRRKLIAIAQFQAIVRTELKEGHDYGVIPGTNKPTLLKPGAEKLAKLLNCYDDYEIVERTEDWDKPLFRYLVRCTLSDMATATKISSGLGECNSYESKYRYRWIPEAEVPAHVEKKTLRTRGGKRTLFEFDFAIEKRETTGQYGKSAEYWDGFNKAIQDGKTRRVTKKSKAGRDLTGQEMDVDLTLYQVPNPDIFDQINTILKMAKKRALVDAALSAGRLSDLFTQDLEDFIEAPAEPNQGPQAEPEQKPTNGNGKYPASPSAESEAKAAVIMARPEQVDKITSAIAAVKTKGIDDATAWSGIYAHAKKSFKREFVELGELTSIEAEAILEYLNGWIDHLDAKAKKASPKKA